MFTTSDNKYDLKLQQKDVKSNNINNQIQYLKSQFIVVPELDEVKQIATSSIITCVIDQEDTLKCWLNVLKGSKNIFKPLGYFKNTKAISMSNQYLCATKIKGLAKCFAITIKPEKLKYKNFSDNEQINVLLKESQTSNNVRSINLKSIHKHNLNILLQSNKQFSMDELYIPDQILNNAIQLKAGLLTICAICKDNELLCWYQDEEQKYQGNLNFIQYKTVPKMQQVEIGVGEICFLNMKHVLICNYIIDDRLVFGIVSKNVLKFTYNSCFVCTLMINNQNDSLIQKELNSKQETKKILKCFSNPNNNKFDRFKKIEFDEILYITRLFNNDKNQNEVKSTKLQICALDNNNNLDCQNLIYNTWEHKHDVLQFSLEDTHACILKLDHKLFCQDMNLVLHEDFQNYEIPTEAKQDIEKVDSQNQFVCTIDKFGSLRCFQNIFPLNNFQNLTPDGFESGTKQVSIGDDLFCAIDRFNNLSCWVLRNTGENPFKQPYHCESNRKAKLVTVSRGIICIIDLNNKTSCYTNNFTSPNENQYKLPSVCDQIEDVKSINTGDNLVCAIGYNNAISCWSQTDVYMNGVKVYELNNPDYIAASREVQCILYDHGKIICAVVKQEDALKINANARYISLCEPILCYINKKNQLLCYSLKVRENLDRTRFIEVGRLIVVKEKVKTVKVNEKQICQIDMDGYLKCSQIVNELEENN